MREGYIKIWRLPIALIVLFLVSTFDLEYGFYTFLRICVCALSLFLASGMHGFNGNKVIITINVIIAILWNPIIPIHLDKDTWVFLDVVASVFECVNGFYSYCLWRKISIEQGYIKKRERKIKPKMKFHYEVKAPVEEISPDEQLKEKRLEILFFIILPVIALILIAIIYTSQ